MKVLHIHEEYPEHDWIRDRDGEIDMWAMSVGFHNGPQCKRCYASYCEHCSDDWRTEPCIVNEDICPGCGKVIDKSTYPNFCGLCGTPLEWEEIND